MEKGGRDGKLGQASYLGLQREGFRPFQTASGCTKGHQALQQAVLRQGHLKHPGAGRQHGMCQAAVSVRARRGGLVSACLPRGVGGNSRVRKRMLS